MKPNQCPFYRLVTGFEDDMWVGAEFGAEIEFMKWKLTSPKIQFKILNENLLTWPEKESLTIT